MTLSFLQAAISVTSIFLQGAIIVTMFRRKLNSVFPFFFSSMIFTAIGSVATLWSYVYTPNQFYAVYWSVSTVMMFIGFGVMYEVFVNMLKPYSAVIDLGKMLFGWAALFLLLAAFLTAMVTSGPRPTRVVVCVELLDRCVHMMQCGMLMLLMLFEKRLNFSWRSTCMAIGLGLGITGGFDLVASYAQPRFPSMGLQIGIAYSVAFVGILAFWSYALIAPAAQRKIIPETPSRLILQRWNEALVSYGYGDTAFSHTESFLPNVERTVDRVLARKIVH